MKNKNIEMRIYELLGVKLFRKIAFMFRDILFFPFIFWMGKEKRKEILYNNASNYIMKKGHGLQDLRDFKGILLLNTYVHVWGLIICLPNFLETINGINPLSQAISNLICIGINLYCIMLQRYNYIRINHVLKKGKEIEEKKIFAELEKNINLSKECTYKIVNKNNREKNIDFENFLKIATPEQLKEYRKFLIKSSNNVELSPINHEILLNKRKTLVLEYKRKR